MMARIAEWRDDLGGLTTSGSATAYSVSTNRGFASAAAMDKQIITIIPHVTSSAAPALAVDGLTARQIRTATGVNVPAGALVAGTPYAFIYLNATTEFILLGVVATLGSLDVTGATALTTPDIADEVPLYDASVAANRKITLGNLFKVIDTFAAKSSPAAADELSLYDVAGAAAKKLGLSDLFKVIDVLTTKTAPVAGDEVVIYDAAGATSKKCTLAQARGALPAFTVQYLTSGTSATYTTPANCRAIRLRYVGGGGGGGANGGAGGTGGTTTFNGVDAAGGVGGAQFHTTGGGGAGGTGGAGSASLRIAGSDGHTAPANVNINANGGNSVFGGGGKGHPNGGTGNAGKANSGGGGGGGSQEGSGGGEYVELLITSPSATYTYTVGAGGSAGSGGAGAGGSGLIIVEEYY
jgi:hypothetical protein